MTVTIEEVFELRDLQEELHRARKYAKAEALRQAEERVSDRDSEYKHMLCKLLANGASVSILSRELGLSRTSIYRFRDEYLESRGYDSIESVFGATPKAGPTFQFEVGINGGVHVIHIKCMYPTPGEPNSVWAMTDGDMVDGAAPVIQAHYEEIIEWPSWLTADVISDAQKETGVTLLPAIDRE